MTKICIQKTRFNFFVDFQKNYFNKSYYNLLFKDINLIIIVRSIKIF